MAVIAVGYVSSLPRASISRDAPHGRILPRRLPSSEASSGLLSPCEMLSCPCSQSIRSVPALDDGLLSLRGPLIDASDPGPCSIDSTSSATSCAGSVVTGPQMPPSQAPSLRLRRRESQVLLVAGPQLSFSRRGTVLSYTSSRERLARRRSRSSTTITCPHVCTRMRLCGADALSVPSTRLHVVGCRQSNAFRISLRPSMATITTHCATFLTLVCRFGRTMEATHRKNL